MHSIDFTKRPDTLSINGFPVHFRRHEFQDGGVLWVPKGISRIEHARSWRIQVAHEEGTFVDNEQDNNQHPALSLAKAFTVLEKALQNGVSMFKVDTRINPPGSPRDPLLDTGFTGVTISRSVRRGQKALVVAADQSVEQTNGKIAHSPRYIGAITDRDVQRADVDPQEKLTELLTKAVAVRRYYNAQRAKGIYPAMPYRYSDVPATFRRQPVELPQIDVYDLFDSYFVIPRPVQPATTGGDPAALVAKLQASDLTQPQKYCYLNGRFIRFAPTELDGRTFYLPKQLYRSQNQWRIKLPHRDGWFCDAIHDSEFGADPEASLKEAWQYLVSLFREYEPPTERIKSVQEPLLAAGVARVFLLALRRVQRRSGAVTWSFTLTLSQEDEPGQSRKVTVGRWSINDLSDESLAEKLRHAEAMDRLRSHRLDQGASLRDAFVNADTHIPAEFWRDAPACPIFADDVRYYVQRRELKG